MASGWSSALHELIQRQYDSSSKFSSTSLRCKYSRSAWCSDTIGMWGTINRPSAKTIQHMDFDNTGKYLLANTTPAIVEVYDWRINKTICTVAPLKGKTKSFIVKTKFLPLHGNLHFASAFSDGHISITEITDSGPRFLTGFSAHRNPVRDFVTLSDTPQVILSVGDDGAMARSDLRESTTQRIDILHGEHQLLVSIAGHPLNPMEVTISGCCIGATTFDLRNLTTPVKSYYSGCSIVSDISYNYVGSELLSVHNPRGVILYDTKSGTILAAYQMEEDLSCVCFFGPKSEYILASTRGGVCMLDLGCALDMDRSSENYCLATNTAEMCFAVVNNMEDIVLYRPRLWAPLLM